MARLLLFLHCTSREPLSRRANAHFSASLPLHNLMVCFAKEQIEAQQFGSEVENDSSFSLF